MSDVTYKASRWGTYFHNLTTNEALGAGAAGPGKTWVLIADPIQQILIEHKRCAEPDACHEWGCMKEDCTDPSHRHPLEWGASKGWALHLRRLFPMLENTLVRCHQLFPAIDPGIRWNEQKHMYQFSSGYRFQFGHCKNDNDWLQYQSQEYTHIAYDELVQFNLEQYEQINTRLRTADPVLCHQLKVRAMSNPVMTREKNEDYSVRDPNWVRKRFVDPEPAGNMVLKKVLKDSDGDTFERTRIYVPATLRDNPNKAFAKQYERELLDKPAHVREALINGNWYITANSFFGEDWNPNLHVCKPFKIPGDWVWFRCLDWGFKTHGACYWCAMDPDGNIYLVREFWFRNQTAKVVAEKIKDYEQSVGLWCNGRSGIPGVADTQLWERRGDIGKSKAREMADVGVVWSQADKEGHSRRRNAERISELLRDHNHGTTTPGLVAFHGCRWFIRTLPGLQVDPDDSTVPMKGGDDHGYDAVCYGVQMQSHGIRGVSRNEIAERNRGPKQSSGSRRGAGRSGYGSSVL